MRMSTNQGKPLPFNQTCLDLSKLVKTGLNLFLKLLKLGLNLFKLISEVAQTCLKCSNLTEISQTYLKFLKLV